MMHTHETPAWVWWALLALPLVAAILGLGAMLAGMSAPLRGGH